MATTSTQTQKELVRLLFHEHGHQKASEMSGVRYDLVRKWASLGKWKQLHKPSQSPVAIAADNVANEIAECERETRLGLARYSKRAAKSAEEASLRDAPYVHKAAQVAGIAFKWDAKEQQSNTVVNVAILGVDPATVSVDTSPIIDVESGVSE